MHLVTLVMGDWGHDERTAMKTLNIESNLSSQDIEEAAYKGCKITGIDFFNLFEEERELSNEAIKAFAENGFQDFLNKQYGCDRDPSDLITHFKYRFDRDDVFDMFLFLVQKADPDFKFLKIPSKKVYIGGSAFFN